MCAPNKLFQSIAAGVPILATENGTFPQYVIDNRAGPIGCVVPFGDKARMIRALQHLLHPATQEEYRQNALRLREDVTWSRQAEILAAIYEKLQKK